MYVDGRRIRSEGFHGGKNFEGMYDMRGYFSILNHMSWLQVIDTTHANVYIDEQTEDEEYDGSNWNPDAGRRINNQEPL